MELTVQVYKGTTVFPRAETYGLAQQMQRAAVSVPSNIAEGKGHHSNKEFVHFLLTQEVLFGSSKHRFSSLNS
jgi:four helix bundle protein